MLAQRAIFHVLFLLVAVASSTTKVNRTIDDAKGDSLTGVRPVYNGAWNALNAANGDSNNIPLDTDLLFDGTWHNAGIGSTEDPLQIQMEFQGTAVYAFFVLPNSGGEGFQGFYQNITFTLDDKLEKVFFNNGSFEPGPFIYNASIFSKEGLDNGNHTLTIVGPPYQGKAKDRAYGNILLFDYVIYTQELSDDATDTSSSISPPPTNTQSSSSDNKSSNSSSSSNTGAIAGGVIGGLVFLAALVVFGIWFLRRRRRHVIDGVESRSVQNTYEYSQVNGGPVSGGGGGLATQQPYHNPFTTSSTDVASIQANHPLSTGTVSDGFTAVVPSLALATHDDNTLSAPSQTSTTPAPSADASLLLKLRREIAAREAQVAAQRPDPDPNTHQPPPPPLSSQPPSTATGAVVDPSSQLELYAVIERLRAQMESLESRMRERDEVDAEMPPSYSAPPGS